MQALISFSTRRVRMLAVTLLATGALVGGGHGFIWAEEPVDDSAQLRLETERAIVFKDGYCLIMKRGAAVTDERGEIHLTDVPDAAVLGAFWALPDQGDLQGMTAGWVEMTHREEREMTCQETIEVLKANEGRRCSVQLPDQTRVSGTIHAVLADWSQTPLGDAPPLAPAVSAAHRLPVRSMRPAVSEDAPDRQLSTLRGQHFVLRTEEGDMLLSASEIRHLTIEDMRTVLSRQVTTRERTKRLTFRFDQPEERQELTLLYFRPGIRWIPTYRIDLARSDDSEKWAHMAMQAELINEAEDLWNTPIDIVVGVPNFRFRSLPSPLILEKTLRDALTQAAPQLMGQSRHDLSNVLFTQRAGEFHRERPGAPAETPVLEIPEELAAAAAEELFVYGLPSLRLRQGERAAVPVLSDVQVPYRDVYTWDVHVKQEDIATAPSGSGAVSPLTLSENEVWRQLEITNSGQVPWTTGTALIMRGHQPLAQELLTYTPPQASTRVPVTVAVDVRGSFAAEEIDREMGALTWEGRQYAKIRQQAELQVTNYKNQPIELEITVRFGGRADEVSDAGHVTLGPFRADDWNQYRGSTAVNNSSTVRWTLELEAGETLAPTVSYHYFARH